MVQVNRLIASESEVHELNEDISRVDDAMGDGDGGEEDIEEEEAVAPSEVGSQADQAQVAAAEMVEVQEDVETATTKRQSISGYSLRGRRLLRDPSVEKPGTVKQPQTQSRREQRCQ